MNEKTKQAIFKMQQLTSDLSVQLEDLRLTLIKEELDIKETDVYKHWYAFYIEHNLKPEEAERRALRRVMINRIDMKCTQTACKLNTDEVCKAEVIKLEAAGYQEAICFTNTKTAFK